MKKTNTVVTRFAPSPTGFKHAGNYRTAWFSYLFAMQHGGSFIIRVEDTDKARNKKEFEENIFDTLAWLNIPFDQKFIQSENLDSHKKFLMKMIDEGTAYISPEEAKDGSGKINQLVRFKNPKEKVSFNDMIRGTIEVDVTDLGDFVIAKNIDEPLFHLAVVVDDFEEGVTHVLRGEDHISNTPRQILIQRAIGAPTPEYAHLSLLMSPDKTKMSARKGALSPTHYRDMGYLPDAMINFLTLLGWHPSDDREVMTREEIIGLFDLSKVQKASAIFDDAKLKWMNREYMLKLEISEYKKHALNFVSTELKKTENFDEIFDRALPTLRDRLSYFGELKEENILNDLNAFFMQNEYPVEMLLCAPKMRKGKEDATLSGVKSILETVIGTLSKIETWTAKSIKEAIWPFAEEQGRGLVLWAMRVALSGKEKSPDPFTMAYILGKTETETRLSNAAKLIA